MKYATYKGLEMSIKNDTSYGRYIIEGNGLKAETTDAEVYDYFDTDYYDEDDKDYAREIAFDLIADKAYEIYGNALCTFNADPSVVEDLETALELARMAEVSSISITPNDVDEDELDAICSMLDLNPAMTEEVYKLGIAPDNALVAF